MRYIFIIIFCCFIQFSSAQTCNAPGQNPSTAFPVCGTTTFAQTTVPFCNNGSLPSPGCPGTLYTDKNPFWYKFTCFQSGTLGFLITPDIIGDDYDWELFDITGRSPNEVYTDASLVISSNWSGSGGVTGASAQGSPQFVCEGVGKPTLSRMSQLVAGHNYLLMISHFTDSQNGYSLEFTGGTASITDPVLPHLKTAEANCGGDQIRVKLNKNMKCSSVAANGSDFSVTPALVNVISAMGLGCGSGFDTDSLQLTLNGALPPGNYVLTVKNGSDGNTISDICDRNVPVNESVNFIILPKVPTPMDSIAPPVCAPRSVSLVFKKPMQCSTVAADGSDFFVTGPYAVTVTAASGNCAIPGDVSKIITVQFSQPLYNAGLFTLHLQTGSDGNTILDECNEETPAGSTINFLIKDTVNADFNYSIKYGCVIDTIQFFNAGSIGVNQWTWSLDEGLNSNLQNPSPKYRVFNEKNITLIVSNGFCKDTASQKVLLDNFLSADFSANEFNCPNEPVKFSFSGSGHISRYDWNFDDGNNATGDTVLHVFPVLGANKTYRVRLTVTDNLGCQKIVLKNITVVRSCYIGVPTGFTPNNDGLNDVLYPMYAIKAMNLEFSIFNRWGQLLFTTNDWRHGWDGTFKGQGQDPGTYVWILKYTDRDTGKKIEQKGYTVLIR
ncbi:MAG: gliding motility-associated C-terminal domain-containing protein [Ferruginibacter sp.]